MSVAEILATTHRRSAKLSKVTSSTVEPPGWDQNRYHICFESDLLPEIVDSIVRGVLTELDWTVSSVDSEDQITISSKRSASRAAQLRPFDETGKKLLGMWSLKDKYPPGIARGGCILTSFEYAIAVQVSPIYDHKVLQETPGGHTEPVKVLAGSRIELWCQEKLSPYRGSRFPSPEVFYVASELDEINPTQAIIEKIETFSE